MEIWKDIKDYPNYQVSNLGNIKSKLRGIISLSQHNGNYLEVRLSKNGIKIKKKIHQLVALNFILNPDNKLEIDHINRNKKDNRVENLRWATRSENVLNTIRPSKLNHKYIYTTPYNNYVVVIKRLNISKTFKTLEEAITYKNKITINNCLTTP